LYREKLLPGVVVHACNPTLRNLRQEDHEFKASLGKTLSQKTKSKKQTKVKENYLFTLRYNSYRRDMINV
jgi:hypothetical protein